ncbi:MAG: FTR1 family protein [Candidatus Bathyarchaeota archaeon]|jgi:high-affinity iron transporter|nr:ferrous iron transporter [Candidatus Bathyarchaeota archaeon A05DMB-5]MDH7557017.1 FTR1 family protein [Candidatus Bathyarchaeota archaeon]
MFGQYLITFRETLEAALIAAIILSYLVRSGRYGLARYVWYGISLAVVASLSLGVIVWFTYGILSETSKLLFEALAAFVAVAVLSFMIYWMAVKGRHIREEMEKHVERAASRSAIIGLSLLGFIVVFREGFETVLFLAPFLLSDTIATLTGMFLGIFTAVLLAYGIFVVGMKINLQRFFYFTSIMLILLAGGLAGYGTHELLEYYEETGYKIGWLSESAYVLNIPADSPFHHKGIIGSIFAVMFGYTVSAEWARMIVHISYLAIALPLLIWVYKK